MQVKAEAFKALVGEIYLSESGGTREGIDQVREGTCNAGAWPFVGAQIG